MGHTNCISSYFRDLLNFLYDNQRITVNMSTEAASTAPKEQAFFAEEASKQILIRIAGVLQDPDLCDASFIVEDGADKEEIRAPSQIMAMSSPYFKSLFYPSIIGDSKEKEINGMQPKTFRKILDYLFRGRVPMSSIEDAWKVKVAGRTFKLKELEDLCTKFLQYRIDARNLIHFLKNTIKYDTPDLRDIVIARLLKDADKAFDNEQILDLSKEELMNIMSRKPQVKASKVMDVLIRWAKKKLALEAPKVEKKEEPEEEGKEEVKDDDVEMKEDKTEETKKDETKEEETKESKLDEEKKEDVKTDEKKEGDEEKKEAVSDDKAEVVELDEKTEESVSEQNLILEIQDFIKYITWEYSDAEYYLKEVKGKFAMSMEDQNLAMTQMLESFVRRGNKQSIPQQNVAKPKEVQEQIRPSSPSRQSAPPKMGPKSAQQMQRGRPVQKR